MNTYISHFDFIRSPSGLEYQSLLGNSMRLNGNHTQGATTLNVVPNLSGAFNPYDEITIFDGANSEIVTVGAAGATEGASNVPISALQFAHNAGTPACSDGVLGSLADSIVKASARMEEIINQSLLSATYTEKLRMPSMDAAMDNQNHLVLRPHCRPVTALSALSIQFQTGQPMNYDPTQAEIDWAERVIEISTLQLVGSSSPATWPGQPLSRQTKAWITITYVAGFTPATMPQIISDTVILLLSSILGRRQNPTGADQINLADKQLIATLRGDPSGESLLIKEVKQNLARYIRKAF